jgi:D-alanine-D-alanine ligase-like ATP-grasp enzyme
VSGVPTDTVTRRLLTGASLAFKIRRRRYHRTSVKTEIAARRAQFYRDIWDEAASATGGRVREVDGELLEVSCADVVVRVRRNLTSLDDPLTVAVAADKPLVYRLLAERGIPVPRHAVCAANDLRRAWAFASSLGRPCVVKPARGASGAIGITTAVAAKADLAWALAYAGAFDRDVLVEEQVGGGVYRLLYFDGELLDAVRRDPPTVSGDGRSSVEELIAAENRRRFEGGIESCQSLIKIDGELRHTLRRAGRGLRTVPATGETVLLKNIVNDNRRDDNVSAAAGLCPEIVAAGAEAAAAVGARLAGVDVITPDPATPLSAAGGVVIEVNAAPGHYYHYYKRDGRVPVATMILERLMKARA